MVELIGDVGSGKTTLTQGILAGLGYRGEVVSPSYTLSRIYPLPNGLTLHHFDFYRLGARDNATDELEAVVDDPQAIVVVEWPEEGEAHLPGRRLIISLAATRLSDEREIKLTASHSDLNYLIEGVGHDYRA